jgi:pimeloyl-ACP methyl ester carboxylesterase
MAMTPWAAQRALPVVAPAFGEALAASALARLYLSGFSDRLCGLAGRGRTSRPAARQFPVLLVHGLCGNRAWSLRLERTLAERGYATRSINYRTVGCGLDQAAAQIAAAADELRHAHRADQVHVVGYSLGGMALRAAYARYGLSEYLAGAVTLSTPHLGTPWAATAVNRLPGVGEILAQIAPGSAYLQALDADTFASANTSWTAVHSSADEIVPGRFGRLDHPLLGATNLSLGAVGHLAMTVDLRVHEMVGNAIDLAEILASGPEVITPDQIVEFGAARVNPLATAS